MDQMESKKNNLGKKKQTKKTSFCVSSVIRERNESIIKQQDVNKEQQLENSQSRKNVFSVSAIAEEQLTDSTNENTNTKNICLNAKINSVSDKSKNKSKTLIVSKSLFFSCDSKKSFEHVSKTTLVTNNCSNAKLRSVSLKKRKAHSADLLNKSYGQTKKSEILKKSFSCTSEKEIEMKKTFRPSEIQKSKCDKVHKTSRCSSAPIKALFHCQRNPQNKAQLSCRSPYVKNCFLKSPGKRFSAESKGSCENSIIEKVFEQYSSADSVNTSTSNNSCNGKDMSSLGYIEFCHQNSDDDSTDEKRYCNIIVTANKTVSPVKNKTRQKQESKNAYLNSCKDMFENDIGSSSPMERETTSNYNSDMTVSPENLGFSTNSTNVQNRDFCAVEKNDSIGTDSKTKVIQQKTEKSGLVKSKKEWREINNICTLTLNNVSGFEKLCEEVVHVEKNNPNTHKTMSSCSPPDSQLSGFMKLASTSGLNNKSVALTDIDNNDRLSQAEESFIVCTQNSIKNTPNYLEKTKENHEEVLKEANHLQNKILSEGFSVSDELEENISNTFKGTNISNRPKSNVVKAVAFELTRKSMKNVQKLNLVSKQVEFEHDHKSKKPKMGDSVMGNDNRKIESSSRICGIGNPVALKSNYSSGSETPDDVQEYMDDSICSEELSYKQNYPGVKSPETCQSSDWKQKMKNIVHDPIYNSKQTKIFDAKKKNGLNLIFNKKKTSANKTSDSVQRFVVDITQSEDEYGQVYEIQETSKDETLISHEEHEDFDSALASTNNSVEESDKFKVDNVNRKRSRNSSKNVYKSIKLDETNKSIKTMEGTKPEANFNPLLKSVDGRTTSSPKKRKLKLKLCKTKSNLEKSCDENLYCKQENNICCMNSSSKEVVEVKYAVSSPESNLNNNVELFSDQSEEISSPINESSSLKSSTNVKDFNKSEGEEEENKKNINRNSKESSTYLNSSTDSNSSSCFSSGHEILKQSIDTSRSENDASNGNTGIPNIENRSATEKSLKHNNESTLNSDNGATLKEKILKHNGCLSSDRLINFSLDPNAASELRSNKRLEVVSSNSKSSPPTKKFGFSKTSTHLPLTTKQLTLESRLSYEPKQTTRLLSPDDLINFSLDPNASSESSSNKGLEGVSRNSKSSPTKKKIGLSKTSTHLPRTIKQLTLESTLTDGPKQTSRLLSSDDLINFSLDPNASSESSSNKGLEAVSRNSKSSPTKKKCGLSKTSTHLPRTIKQLTLESTLTDRPKQTSRLLSPDDLSNFSLDPNASSSSINGLEVVSSNSKSSPLKKTHGFPKTSTSLPLCTKRSTLSNEPKQTSRLLSPDDLSNFSLDPNAPSSSVNGLEVVSSNSKSSPLKNTHGFPKTSTPLPLCTKRSTLESTLSNEPEQTSRLKNIRYKELNVTASEGLLDETVKNIQCFLISGEEELEKLKELNIDVDWELPRLHQLDNGSQKMSLKLLQKKTQSENIKLSSTNFTEKEQIKIKRNWIKFCKVYKFSDPSLFMPSNQLYGCFKLKERLKFKQFLARGLPDRRLYSVYAKFCNIYGVSVSGRWTNKEDRLLLDLYKAFEESDGEIKWGLSRNVILNKALRRNWMSVHRRLNLLLNDEASKLATEEDIDWTHELSGKLIHRLLKKTKSSSLEELRHSSISYNVWHSVSVKLDLSFDDVVNHWRFTLYPQLFSRQPVLRSALYGELISWLHSSGLRKWKHVDWSDLSRRAGDLGPCFLLSCFKALVSNHVPKDLHSNLRACVKFLHKNYLPTLEIKKESRLLKRLKYNQDSRAVEEVENEEELPTFSIE